MKIDIKHIAKLSRLRIEDDKLEKFEKDMESIVNMVDRLPDVEGTLDLNPKDTMTLREDKAVTDKFKREELLKMHRRFQAGCLVVPKTVE